MVIKSYFKLGLLGSILFIAFSPTAGAVSWSWTNDKPVVYSSVTSELGDDASCVFGIVQNHYVAGNFDPIKMCISANENIRFGQYQNSMDNVAVVGFGNDSQMYEMDGKCADSNTCLYLPGTDILVRMEHISNKNFYGLVLYKNFSSRLSRYFDPVSLTNKYKFDDSGQKYIFKKSDGYSWIIGGKGASANGKWLAVEFYEKGLGLLNVETLQMKRISDRHYHYDMIHPSVEFAVSNDGSHVAIMGDKAGIAIYDVDQNCGDIATDLNMYEESDIDNPCKAANTNLDIIPSFASGFGPRFSDDGGELDFYATSTSVDGRRVVLRVANYYTAKLDYLAMGDSYSSGQGELDGQYYINGTNADYEKCHTSKRSYPFVISELMGLSPDLMRSVACSGARTIDVIGADEGYYGQGERLGIGNLNLNSVGLADAQAQALSLFIPGRSHQVNFVQIYKPAAITIGIGGNDAGFMEKLTGCLGPTTCKWAGTDEGKAKTLKEINNLYEPLVNTYRQIKQKSPDSKLYAIGYPKIVDEIGECSAFENFLFDSAERKFIADDIEYLNQVVARAAAAENVKYVDIFDSFGDHVICGSDSQKAINTVALGDDLGPFDNFKWLRLVGAESFHPNAYGHNLTGHKIFDQIGNLLTYEYSPAVKAAPQMLLAKSIPVGDVIATQKNIEFAKRQISLPPSNLYNIVMPKYSFNPNSSVSLTVDFADQLTKNITAQTDGSIQTTISLPADLVDGYYVLHLLGNSYSGEPVDIYQVIKRMSPVINIDVTNPPNPGDLPTEEPEGEVNVLTPIVVDDDEDHGAINIIPEPIVPVINPIIAPIVQPNQIITIVQPVTVAEPGSVWTEPSWVSPTNNGYLMAAAIDQPEVKGATITNKASVKTGTKNTNFIRDWLIPRLGLAIVLAIILAYIFTKTRKSKRRKTHSK